MINNEDVAWLKNLQCGFNAAMDAETSRCCNSCARRIALLHGTLDPITDAILKMAADIVSGCYADEVWLVPAAIASSGTSKRQRLAMCHLAVETVFLVTTPVYVVDADSDDTAGELSAVLRVLKDQHKSNNFFLVCGMEAIDGIRKWQDGERLWNEIQWLIVPRSATSRCLTLPPKATVLGDERQVAIENSPAELRLRLQHNKRGAEGLVPVSVLSFIERYGLYGVCVPQQTNRRVAVLGGSFSPPTSAHIQMAADLIHSGLTDEVLIVPCGPRTDKASLDVPAGDRYTMCELAIAATFSSSFPVRVDCIEIDRPVALSSLELSAALRERDPSCVYQLVFGADLYEASKSWDDGRFWFENDFLWVPRSGYPLPSKLEKGAEVIPPRVVIDCRSEQNVSDTGVLPCTSLELSSTILRKRYKEGNVVGLETLAGSPSVFSYWRRYGLYMSS